MGKFCCVILAVLLYSMAWAQTEPELAQALPFTPKGLAPEDYAGLPQYPIHLTYTYPPQSARFPGYFQVAFDNEALYLFARLQQPTRPVAEREALDPNWWQDDTLEVFLRSNPWDADSPDLHLAVNAKGVRFQTHTSPLLYEAAAGITADGWWAELRIPFGKDLPRPNLGEFWQLKVGRGYPEAGEYTLWPIGGAFHSPGNYGYLFFTQEPQAKESLVRAVIEREANTPPIVSRLGSVQSWAVYYGADSEDYERLHGYDLVVLAREAPLSLVEELKRKRVRVVAYLPLGFLSHAEVISKGLTPLTLGLNPFAPDTYFMNIAHPDWRAWVLKEAERLLSMGHQGFFLDGLDLADVDPQSIPHLASLVKELRSRFPEVLLLQHRGFRVLRRTAPALDAVVYSYLSTNPAGQPFAGDPSPVWPFRKRGLITLSLDIASNPEHARWAQQRAINLGFVPFVTSSLTSLNSMP